VTDALGIVARVAVIGAGGALAMDAWSLVLRRGFGIPTLDYALLGRWLGHMAGGRFTHHRIAAAAPIPGERPLGWVAHYAIGVTFAALLVAIWGTDWLAGPSLAPALLVGLGTIVAPWFVMQPAMGAGFAGSRTPSPRATRLRNLGTHAAYGVGLYLTAAALALG
jgi:hypothetical protein